MCVSAHVCVHMGGCCICVCLNERMTAGFTAGMAKSVICGLCALWEATQDWQDGLHVCDEWCV